MHCKFKVQLKNTTPEQEITKQFILTYIDKNCMKLSNVDQDLLFQNA